MDFSDGSSWQKSLGALKQQHQQAAHSLLRWDGSPFHEALGSLSQVAMPLCLPLGYSISLDLQPSLGSLACEPSHVCGLDSLGVCLSDDDLQAPGHWPPCQLSTPCCCFCLHACPPPLQPHALCRSFSGSWLSSLRMLEHVEISPPHPQSYGPQLETRQRVLTPGRTLLCPQGRWRQGQHHGLAAFFYLCFLFSFILTFPI